MAKVSWVILTHNRPKITNTSFQYNIRNIGIDTLDDLEIIWVDNGSDELNFNEFRIGKVADSIIVFRQNRGVAKGYNAGMALATGDYIVITGCDRLMPDRWLQRWLHAIENIASTGVISCYSKSISECPDRISNPIGMKVNDIDVIGCLPFEARIFKRSLLSKFGYFHEGFGVYGFEDCEWASRVTRISKELNLFNYTLPDFTAEHLGTEGIHEWDGKDAKDYHEFKQREVKDPAKQRLFDELARQGFPYYNPFL